MTRADGARLFSGLALLLAVAAVTGAGSIAGGPGPARTVAAGVPAVRDVPLEVGPTLLACPAAPRLTTSEAAAGTDPEFEAVAETTGHVTAVATGSPAPGIALLAAGGETAGTAREQVSAVAAPGLDGPTVRVAPDGNRPPRAAALATATAPAGDLRGLAAASCASPLQDGWLLAGATVPGRSARLDLTNPGTSTVTADVTVLTPQGPLQPPAAQGVPLAPGEGAEILLEGLAPDAEALAVHVTASGGSVTAFVVETALDGLTPAGVEVVGAAGEPAPAHVLPGVSMLPDSAPPRLRVAVPGQHDAVVRWQVHGPAGPVETSATQATTVPAGTVADVELAGLERGTYSVVLDADVPVLAAVASTSGGQGAAADTGWSAPAPALDEEALVALPPAGVRARLVVTGGGAPAELDVRTVAADGTTARTDRVSVGAGSTAVLPVPELDEPPLALLVRPAPGAGPAHAALLLTAGADGGAELLAATPVRLDRRAPGSIPVRPLPEGRWP